MTFRTFGGGTATISFGSPSGDVAVGNAETEGTSTDATRADHVHAFPVAATGAGATDSAPGDAEADGTATTASRSDHVHGREAWGTTADIGTGVIGTAAGAGSTGAVADAGHTHLATAYGTASDIGTGVLGTAAAAGSTGTVADAGHTHLASDFGAVADIAELAAAAAAGSTGAVADAGHVHPYTGLLPLDTVTAIGDLIVGSGSGAVTALAPGTAGQYLTANGSGSQLTWTTPTGASAMTFVDGAVESLGLGTTSAAAMTGTSTASSTNPVRVHNLTLTTSAAGNNGTYTAKITGSNSGDTYVDGFFPAVYVSDTSAVESNVTGIDLIVTEPLEITVGSSLVYTADYSVGVWSSIS